MQTAASYKVTKICCQNSLLNNVLPPFQPWPLQHSFTRAQAQIWHWQTLQTTGESQEMLPVHGCTLLNAAKSWGKYLYSSCLCSQEMCPLHLAECMIFPAWCPGQQLWQGEQWRTTAMDSRDHHPPGNCSGVIQRERGLPKCQAVTFREGSCGSVRYVLF